MKDNIAKITHKILYVLLAISAVAGLFFYVNLLSVDLFLNIGKLILIIALLIFAISPVYGFITNPQNVKLLLISLGLGAVIIIISYLISGNKFTALQLEQYGITANLSRWVETGLIATYIMFALSILTLVYSAIYKVFK